MRQSDDPGEPTLDEKVRFLSEPASYPDERPVSVTVIETHFSWVFLTTGFVYKLKKPARYPFLDLSSPKLRLQNCQEEVRLNHMVAPSVYLGVITLRTDPGGAPTFGGDRPAVDYLVHMRRLSDTLNLETQLRAGTVRPEEVDRAARRLTAFYLESDRAPGDDAGARRRRFSHLAGELGELLGPSPRGEALRDHLLDWLDRHGDLLETRRRVDAHGDLRPQHVYLGEDPLFIDRLEFDARLRALDPVEELCFLTLECERLGARWVGERFLDINAEASGTARLPELERFYEAGRALLWAVLSARHLVTSANSQPRWRERACYYLDHGLDRVRAR